MPYLTDFVCKKCDNPFELEWVFGDIVTCLFCRTKWETDYEEDEDGNITGPWIGAEVSQCE